MMEPIEGRHALVTGGAQGIGAATVVRLRKAGARVTVLDLRLPEQGEREDALYLQCDVSSPEGLARALEEARGRQGAVEILVNNAGVMFPGDFLDRDFSDWEKTLEVNLRAALRLCYALLPGMIEADRGIIVNVVSASATLGVPGLAVYGAAKWALWGFTEAVIGELKNRGSQVHVAAVLPNFIRHGLFQGAHLSGLGGFIVPRVKSHDVIARAIVEGAIRRRKALLLRPRSVRSALLMRGTLPYRLFLRLTRGLGAATSMRHLAPRGASEDR